MIIKFSLKNYSRPKQKILNTLLFVNFKDDFTSFPFLKQQVSFKTSYINLTLSIQINSMYLPKTSQFNVRTNIIVFAPTNFDEKHGMGGLEVR